MKVRICSCPGRDKKNEEQTEKAKHGNTLVLGKRAATEEDNQPAKLKKVEGSTEVNNVLSI
jgi:hypothetical protein